MAQPRMPDNDQEYSRIPTTPGHATYRLLVPVVIEISPSGNVCM